MKATMHVVSEGTGKENDIYKRRFNREEEATRRVTWNVLCRDFLQQYIGPKDVVVDVGAGDGHFLRNITCGRKIAVDLSPHVRELSNVGVEVVQVGASEFSQHIPEKADIVFMSNFLEHLPNKQMLLEVLAECRRALKPGGMLLILQPNIRYAGVAYWDYIDHHIALTEHSLAEALEVSGYSIVRMIPRFLPYTAKSGLGRLMSGGRHQGLVRWYLKLPILWKIFGQQTFVLASSKSLAGPGNTGANGSGRSD